MRWLLLLAVVSGCGDRVGNGADLAVTDDLSVSPDLSPPPPVDLARHDAATGDGGFATHSNVDILFIVDNSPSMTPKQTLLRQSFATFVGVLQGVDAGRHASYHMGVITDDLGAGPFTLNQGQCSPGGMGAKMQSKASSNDTGAPAACSSFALGGGVSFIEYDPIHSMDNLGGVDVTTALTCLASVGAQGCGFEQPLEAAYQALHDPIAENNGFVRSDALLVVVFVTDEDDCSAPATTDLFDPSTNGVNMYGVEHSFRCTQWGIACGTPGTQVQPIDSGGPLSMCRPWTVAEGSQLIDVQKYIDYFGKPAAMGGVKADPNDVIVASIAAPATPLSTVVTSPCADQVNTASCPILNHSCVQPANAQIFGDPAVRLSAVVAAAATSQQSSVCDTNYTMALGSLAGKIVSRLQ